MFDPDNVNADEQHEETGEAGPVDARPAPAATVSKGGPLPDPGAVRDTLQLYLSWIRDIPVLDRDQVSALSAQMDDCELRFRDAIIRVPATSIAVVERWRARKDAGRTTALLAHGYRGDVNQDWAGHIDRHVGALDRRLRRLTGPSDSGPAARKALRVDASERARLADHLCKADVLLEELIEIHDALIAVVADRDQSAGRRRAASLGLGAAAARKSLAEATRALADRNAVREQFATHNLRLVVNVAKRFRGLGLSYMDLIQEGNKGLMRAVEKYDHTKGFTFSTYAVWWIDQAIIRGIQNHSRTVRIPSHVHQEQRRVRQLEEDLRRSLRRDPSADELAEAAGLDREELELIQVSHRPIQSLDEPVGEKGNSTVTDTLMSEPGPDPCANDDQRRLRSVLTRGLRGLEERERAIIRMRYGLDGEPPRTLRAIGQQLGISRERVRQIEVKSLAALRQRDDVDALSTHLETPLAAA